MRPPITKRIDVNEMARKKEVDDRIPLRNYYRIADNLLKQARIYREEKNIIDLYVILLRYSSLVLDTITFHRDYQALCLKERAYCKKQVLGVLDELESLKPEVDRQVGGFNRAHSKTEDYQQNGNGKIQNGPSFQLPAVNNNVSFVSDSNQSLNMPILPSSHGSLQSSPIDMQFQKLSLLPPPKQETLSRHSLLGPNGLRGQRSTPNMEIKVQYPTYSDLSTNDDLSLIQSVQRESMGVKDSNSGMETATMESVLSLDDGRWTHPGQQPRVQFDSDDFFCGNIIRQPSPPPVLARVTPQHSPISPTRVADPRPGPAKSFQDNTPTPNGYQHLHIPLKMMQDFLRLAQENTKKNLETCGVLAGSLKNRVFHITTLIIPKQESTSDSCQTLNEEDIFEVQDTRSLFQLGWIHTHPSQSCFMSSVDLHTHYSYQIMLPEAIAIVMAPTDESCPHGIFHLSDPGGVNLIRKCDQRGFHPHEEPDDGTPIYEHCSHVYINETLRFDVLDLR